MRSVSKVCSVVLFATASCMILTTPSLAQVLPSEGGSTGGLSSLLTLPGEEAMVRYAPGSLDRAARLHGRLTGLSRQLKAWSPRRQDRVRLAAYVLGPEEWGAQGLAFPYGFPVRVAPLAVATPAWGTEESVATWASLLGGSGSSLAGGADFAVRGTPEELSSLALADAFLQLELCRMFIERQRLTGAGQDPWLADIVAHLLSLTVDQSGEGAPVGLGGVLLFAQAGRPVPPGVTLASALADYGRELELESWLWYQGRFAAAAQDIWSDRGKSAVKQILKLRRQRGAPLSFGDLAGLFPSLVSWRAEAFPGG